MGFVFANYKRIIVGLCLEVRWFFVQPFRTPVECMYIGAKIKNSGVKASRNTASRNTAYIHRHGETINIKGNGMMLAASAQHTLR